MGRDGMGRMGTVDGKWLVFFVCNDRTQPGRIIKKMIW